MRLVDLDADKPYLLDGRYAVNTLPSTKKMKDELELFCKGYLTYLDFYKKESLTEYLEGECDGKKKAFTKILAFIENYEENDEQDD